MNDLTVNNGAYKDEQWHKLQLAYEEFKKEIEKELNAYGEGGFKPGTKVYDKYLKDEGYGYIQGIEPYFDHLEKRYKDGKISGKTKNYHMSTIAHHIRQHLKPKLSRDQRAFVEEWIKDEIKKRRVKEKPRAVTENGILSRDEIQSLIIHLNTQKEREKHKSKKPQDWGKNAALMVEFLANSGARISEMIGIRLSDIKQNGETAILLRGKGRKEREIFFPDQALLDHIRDHFRGKTYLFEHDGKPFSRNYLLIALRKAGRELLGRDISPHTLRHSFATRAIKKGVDVKAVADHLGHSSTSITLDMYVHTKMTKKQLKGLWE